MRIEKYKKLKNGKYEVILEDHIRYELYEDTILKYDLLLTRKIEETRKKEILDFDQKMEVYYMALKYLKTRARSRRETEKYLQEKQYNIEYIKISLDQLENQGYLNDMRYAKSFLNNKVITTTNGPLKIRQELLKKEIDVNIIDEVLEEYTEDRQKEKIQKIMLRMIKSNRNKGINLLKRKIMSDLIIQGFNKDLIVDAIDHYDFGSDDEMIKREYDSLYRKLSRKYSGNELELKIKQKMYQKGLAYEK